MLAAPLRSKEVGLGGRIRTCDLLIPSQAGTTMLPYAQKERGSRSIYVGRLVHAGFLSEAHPNSKSPLTLSTRPCLNIPLSAGRGSMARKQNKAQIEKRIEVIKARLAAEEASLKAIADEEAKASSVNASRVIALSPPMRPPSIRLASTFDTKRARKSTQTLSKAISVFSSAACGAPTSIARRSIFTATLLSSISATTLV